MYLVLGSVIRHWKSSTRVFIGLELRGGKLQKKTFSTGGFACLCFPLKFLDIIYMWYNIYGTGGISSLFSLYQGE